MTPDDVGPLRVTVALLTFRRPADLAEALALVLAQLDDAPGCTVDVLVVDNDPGGSGGPAVRALRGNRGLDGDRVLDRDRVLDGDRVRHVVEPEPGIAAGRNRVLDETAGSDLLVFVDDDERPHPGWLAGLLDTRARTGAAAVAGAVVSGFDGPLDPWIAAGRFFDRRRLPTGTRIDTAATNNLLLDLRVTRRLGLRFDAGLGLSGGSDTAFTRSLTRAGELMVWCDEAVVTDRVPTSRMTRRWVLHRAWRMGNSSTVVDVRLAVDARSRLRARGHGCAAGVPRALVGAARFGVGVLTRSTEQRSRGLRTAARGAGMVAGAFGHVYQEYGR